MQSGVVWSKNRPLGIFALVATAVVVIAAMAAVVVTESPVQSTSIAFICPEPLRLVAPNVCDDNVDTAYLAVRSERYLPDDQILQQIVASKKAWEAKFPERRIVAMIRTEQSSGGSSVLTGVLIHYTHESK